VKEKTQEEKFLKRRFEEGWLFENIGKLIELRRLPLTKQTELKRKVRVSRADYTFLQFNRTVRRWAIFNHDLTGTELDMLLYLYPITVFSVPQFKTFQYELGLTDHRLFKKMESKKWFNLWSRKGQISYYVLSRKGNLLCSRMHRMYMLEEEIPLGLRRNKSSGRKDQKHKKLMDLYKEFNQKVREKHGK